MLNLTGKTGVVTGGASGIGAAIVERLASAGAHMVVADIADSAGKELVERLGADHLFVHLDVTQPESWEAAMRSVDERFGRLDILCLNAGAMTRPYGADIFNDPLQWINPGSYRKVVDVCEGGTVFGVIASLPYLERQGGHIIVTSSGAGLSPYPGDPMYAMAKYGLIGLSLSLAPTLAERGVAINVVCPRGIDTPMCPPDLRAKKEAEGTFAPPSHLADTVAHMLDHAGNGEIWLGRVGEGPCQFKPTEPAPPAPVSR